MILSDNEIIRRIHKGDIRIKTQSHYDIFSQIGPASFDFRLGGTFKYYNKKAKTVIDVKKGIDPKHIGISELGIDKPLTLNPGDFILGSTLEIFRIPVNLVARCEGRSSLGRLGLIIHSTAGFIDPGFEGTITLEITNINKIPIILYTGMRIGQLAFQTLEGDCNIPYNKREGSKYMGQISPQESKIDKDLF